MGARHLRRPLRGDLPKLFSCPLTAGTVRALGEESTVTAANGEASKGSLLKVCPWVTHERLDDEVIAINLETGAYFVLEGAAAECWTALVDGASPESVARHLQSRYDVTEERALTDSMSVLAELQASAMVGVVEGDEPA